MSLKQVETAGFVPLTARETSWVVSGVSPSMPSIIRLHTGLLNTSSNNDLQYFPSASPTFSSDTKRNCPISVVACGAPNARKSIFLLNLPLPKRTTSAICFACKARDSAYMSADLCSSVFWASSSSFSAFAAERRAFFIRSSRSYSILWISASFRTREISSMAERSFWSALSPSSDSKFRYLLRISSMDCSSCLSADMKASIVPKETALGTPVIASFSETGDELRSISQTSSSFTASLNFALDSSAFTHLEMNLFVAALAPSTSTCR